MTAMHEVTLCLPVCGDPIEAVLLGWKKSGFGQGKYTGFGGKVAAGESAANAAARELFEEVGIVVLPNELQPLGTVTFLFPARPAWNQRAHIFLVDDWLGTPTESTEMKPCWFARHDLPLANMWADAAHWLPRALARQTINATFVFAADNETILL
jgi:8-oxo-dGTP diphosphatase